MAKKKNEITTTNNELSKILTQINLTNLSSDITEQLMHIVESDDFSERTSKRLELSKVVYSSIYNEMINKILFSTDFMEELTTLSIKDKIDVLMKLSKFNFVDLQKENNELKKQNEGYKIELISYYDNQNAQEQFLNNFEDLTSDQKLEALEEQFNLIEIDDEQINNFKDDEE